MIHSIVSTFDLERDSSSFRLLPLLSLITAISTFLLGLATFVSFCFVIFSPKYTSIIRIFRRLSIDLPIYFVIICPLFQKRRL